MKINNSSCRTHGFRMCGYNTFEGEKPVFVDKMVGRKLTADGLQEMFLHFFQGNLKLVQDVLSQVEIVGLSIASTKGCRLHGSSLLIAYCAESGLTNCKLVDFQNCAIEPDGKEADEDALFGI